jgi:peptidoglycan/LPS O-acetylase OafA/YrhL
MTDLEVLLTGCAVSLAVAAMSFYWFEKPFLRLKTRFA